MKSPSPPSPTSTAAAQQAAEMGASWTSGIINNPNIVNPYGTQTYKIAGYETVKNAKGQDVKVPRYTQTQTLSAPQQKILDANNAMQLTMSRAGAQQASKLGQHLQGSVNPAGWQAWNAGPNAPKLATGFANVGGPQRSIAGGGKIANSFSAGGPIQNQIGAAQGKIDTHIGNQTVRQDTAPTDRKAIENAMMANYTQDTAGQNAAMDAQMAARGLNPGSSQYGGIQHQRALDRGRAVNEAYLASGNESRAAQDAFNQAAGQRFSQEAQQAQFGNQAQQQSFDQQAQRAGFANAAQMQQYQQNQGLAQFGNQAQLQQFQQNAAQGQFANSAQEAAYNQAMQRAGFSNEALANMYNMGGQSADRQNALRGQQMEQSFALRNQPINEIAALMAGGQVTMPQFSPYQGQGVNAAPIGQYIANNYAQQNAQAGAFNTGLFNLAGAGVTGLFGMSDRRMKFDIQPIGGDLAGAPLYTFRFKHDPEVLQTGVMADEVRALHPDAVLDIDGIDHVNYGLLAARHGG